MSGRVRLSRRGRRVLTALALTAGLAAGMTAQRWNTYTAELDRHAHYDMESNDEQQHARP